MCGEKKCEKASDDLDIYESAPQDYRQDNAKQDYVTQI